MVSAPFSISQVAPRRNVTGSRMPQRITVAHSPDADDAFMFYALAQGKVRDPDLEFVHVLQDIQTLNERAFQGAYQVTADPGICASARSKESAASRARPRRRSATPRSCHTSPAAGHSAIARS